MNDRVWTKIIFPAYAMRIAEVVKAIDQECPEDCDAGVDDQEAPDGALVAIADNTYGGFDILQPVLQKLRIPFDLWTEADHERAELIVYYRTGEAKKQDYHYRQYCANNMAVVSIEEITSLVKNAKTDVATAKALKALLKEHAIPPLREVAKVPTRLEKKLALSGTDKPEVVICRAS